MIPKSSIPAALVMVAALLGGANLVRAHVNDNVKPGSDILMKDLRWPEWDAGTYYCTWYTYFTYPEGISKDLRNNLYGGVRTRGPKGPTGMFWTFWGDIKGVSAGRQFSGGSGYGAEGAAGGFNGRPDFLRPNSWYRFVMRVYPPLDEEKAAAHTHVGWWIKDVEKGRWYHHSTAELRGPANGIKANGGFVEAMAGGDVRRVFERRLGYGRLAGGEWYKADGIDTNLPQHVKIIENGAVLRFDTAYDGGKKPDDGWIRTTNQPDRPDLDPVIIAGASATGFGDQVSIHWEVPPASSPQMGHRIEVFAKPDARGAPLLVDEENANYLYGKRFDLREPAASVRLTVIDIFSQEKSVVLPVKSAALAAPPATSRSARFVPGLLYEVYEAPKGTQWTKLDDLPNAGAVRKGIVSHLDHSVRGALRKNYGMRFAGFLKVPEDGLYMLMAGSSDGSRLFLDGKLVVDNDGVHGSTPGACPLALKKGLHRFEFEHFVGGGRGGMGLVMRWEGPGFERRDFTSDDFRCEDSGELPVFDLRIATPVVDGVPAGNLAEFHAAAGLRGHEATEVQLYADRKIIASAGTMNPRGRAVFKVLLPKGKRNYWARLWYDDGNSVNSRSTLPLDVKNNIGDDCPWTFTLLNNDVFPVGARYHHDKASFTGEGYYFAHQKVSGDFTLTGRIAEIALTTRENGIDQSSWIGLLTTRAGGSPPPYATSHYSIFRTAGRGMRTKPDTRDLGGGNISSREVGDPDHRWLRIVRRGMRCAAYTSADGREWVKVNEQIAGSLTGERLAGICYRAIPGKGRRFFHASMDHLTIENRAIPEPPRPKPAAREVSLEDRITAVAQSPSEPNILYARSPDRGVLLSTDRGDTWREVNGRLRSPVAMAVRSVAVHYENPEVVLRGGGAVSGGKLKSGLWKSTNGGKSWKLVSDRIDFDGSGPGALLGEVIAFSRTSPDLVVAAGESGGLFVSRDAGDTFEPAGKLAGERVTALAFSRDPQRGVENLMAGTFADSEFEALGLGKPHLEGPDTGAVFVMTITDSEVKGGRPILRAPEFGVTGVAFGTYHTFYNIATTRGVYHRWPHGSEFLQKRQYMPSDTLNVAFGHWRRLVERRNGPKRLHVVGYTAPFSTPGGNRLYRVAPRPTGPWKVVHEPGAKLEGAPPGACLSSGLTCIHPDHEDAATLFACNADGIYKSTDEGKTFRLVCKSGP